MDHQPDGCGPPQIENRWIRAQFVGKGLILLLVSYCLWKMQKNSLIVWSWVQIYKLTLHAKKLLLHKLVVTDIVVRPLPFFTMGLFRMDFLGSICSCYKNLKIREHTIKLNGNPPKSKVPEILLGFISPLHPHICKKTPPFIVGAWTWFNPG